MRWCLSLSRLAFHFWLGGFNMVFVEVRFKNNGYAKVYFDGDDVVIDFGAYRYRRRMGEGFLKDKDALIYAVGEFAGQMNDVVEEVVA